MISMSIIVWVIMITMTYILLYKGGWQILGLIAIATEISLAAILTGINIDLILMCIVITLLITGMMVWERIMD